MFEGKKRSSAIKFWKRKQIEKMQRFASDATVKEFLNKTAEI